MNENEFRIGHVLRQAMATAWTGLGRWLALSALVQLPLIFYRLTRLSEHLPQNEAMVAIHATLHLAVYVLAEAAVVAAMLAQLRGQRESLGALLGMAFRPGPLLWFAVVYGFIASFVAYAPYWFQSWFNYWFTFWYSYWIDFGYQALLYLFIAVTIPVLVNERTGVLEALKRNVSLTSRHRGRLFGIYVLLSLTGWFLFLPVQMWATRRDTTEGVMETFMMWSLASSVIGPVIWGAINATIYRSLRQIREGVDITSTPSVPDARIHTPG